MSLTLNITAADLEKRVAKAQKLLDSEILRMMEPYTPIDTGMMIKSAIQGTVIGSGRIVYDSVYARRQYYENTGRLQLDKRRGRLWFERMKADRKDVIQKIIQGAL